MRPTAVVPAVAALLALLPCRQAGADDLDDAVKQAERELASTPKRIDTAGGLWLRLLASGRDAEGATWKKRIVAACQDSATIGCGHQIAVYEDGSLARIAFTKSSWVDSGTAVGQPFTVKVFKDKTNTYFGANEVGAVAGKCGVQGLDYGAGAESNAHVVKAWPVLKKQYRDMMKVDANLIIECGFGVPINRKDFPAKPFLWEVDAATIVHNGANVPVQHIFMRLERQRLLLMMRTSDKKTD